MAEPSARLHQPLPRRSADRAAHQDALRVASGDSRQEREADAAADRAVATLFPAGEREPEHGHGAGLAGGQAPDNVTSYVEQARGTGAPLPSPVRSRLEGAFDGTDLGHVRLHADAAASRAAEQLSAAAFTTGPDVFLHASARDVSTPAGASVLAHEVAHTLQRSDVVQRKGLKDFPRSKRQKQAPPSQISSPVADPSRPPPPGALTRVQADAMREQNRRESDDHREWSRVRELLAVYDAKKGGRDELGQHLIEQMQALLRRLDETGKASEHATGASGRLAEQVRKQYDRIWADQQKLESWLARRGDERSRADAAAPGKAEAKARFTHLTTDATAVEKLSDVHTSANLWADDDGNDKAWHSRVGRRREWSGGKGKPAALTWKGGRSELNVVQHMTEMDAPTKAWGRFGVTKKEGEMTVPVNIDFQGKNDAATVQKVQDAIDKYWNVFVLTYKSSARKGAPPPASTSVKLTFVVGKTVAALSPVKKKDPPRSLDRRQAVSPMLASHEAASLAKEKEARRAEREARRQRRADRAAKVSDVSLTTRDQAILFAERAQEVERQREQAERTQAETAAGGRAAEALKARWEVKAAKWPVSLFEKEHPQWKARMARFPSPDPKESERQAKTRSDAANWKMDGTRAPMDAAHEFGHLLGLPDEYGRTHGDMKKITKKQPNAYTKKGQLDPTRQATYTDLVAKLAAAKTAGSNLYPLAHALSLLKYDERALFSTHHLKETGKRLDQDVDAVLGAYAPGGVTTLTGHDEKTRAWLVQHMKQSRAHFRSGFRTGGIMGDYTTVPGSQPAAAGAPPVLGAQPDTRANAGAHDHMHPLEPRHVRMFAQILGRMRGETWQPEHR